MSAMVVDGEGVVGSDMLCSNATALDFRKSITTRQPVWMYCAFSLVKSVILENFHVLPTKKRSFRCLSSLWSFFWIRATPRQ